MSYGAGVIAPAIYAAGVAPAGTEVNVSPGESLKFRIRYISVYVTFDGSPQFTQVTVGLSVIAYVETAGPDDGWRGIPVDVTIVEGDSVRVFTSSSVDGNFLISGEYWSAGE